MTPTRRRLLGDASIAPAAAFSTPGLARAVAGLTGANPTPTLAALAYRSLGRLRDEYLTDPRPLDG